ncbi:MAG: N-acetylglucosamine-6-phosphate deacetylase [Anaerolineae bacterium]|jgi:N-acetylglucosamine-6-phosphate deacetylase
MTTHLFYNGDIVTEAGTLRGWVLVEGGRIADLGTGGMPTAIPRRTDLQGRLLAPGMIDVHAHGALGCDAMDANPASLRQMAGYYASHGVTAFLPTTMTAPHAEIMAALTAVRQAAEQGTGGAQVLGAHVEGPYLNRDKRGAQIDGQIRLAQRDEYEQILGTGMAKLITVAPEYPENLELIRVAASRGVAVTAGHTTATYEQMRRAALCGLSQVTHLFNGMEPLHHRQPGAVGAALSLDAIRCQLIADNIHLHPGVLKLAVRAKGVEGILLVTDAMSGAGMPDGDYELGGQHVIVRDGECRLENGALAGSTLTMDRAVRNIMAACGLGLEGALPMATRVPAASLGLAGRKGTIAAGYDADLIVIDRDVNVYLTMVGGEVVYQAPGV